MVSSELPRHHDPPPPPPFPHTPAMSMKIGGRLHNKKVLLRERKRHTARRVVSARYAGGVPHPVMVGGTPFSHGGGYPIQSWWGGYPGYPPPSRPGMGYPHHPDHHQTWDGVPPHHSDLGWVPPTIQTWDGVPPTIQTWDGVTPPPSRSEMGYPPTIHTWDGITPPPHPHIWDGVPPPESWTDTHLWKHNLPSYVLRTRMVTSYWSLT